MNQTHTSGRVAPPFEWRSVNRIISGAFEIIGTSVFLSLLLVKRLQNAFVRMHPVRMKTRSVAGCLPVSIRESHRIAERIDLPLALAQLRRNRRLVVLAPWTSFGAEVERVCIRVNEDTARLPVNNSGDQLFVLPVSSRVEMRVCVLCGGGA